MPYTNIVSRSDAAALIPEVVSNDIMGGVVNESAALTLFRQIPMSSNVTRMPVLSALPTAYFVTGDTGLKQTTEAAWSNKYLNAEELAAIVPIPEAVLDDINFDVWGSVQPLLVNAIARALDAAIFFGVNKPSSWPSDIATAAAAATNTVNRGTNAAAAGGVVGDMSDLFALVEADGFDVNGLIANTTYKGRLRQARATTGESLVGINDQVTASSVYGVDVLYPMRGLWPSTTGGAEAFAGDFTQGVLGVRQDITWKVLDQAVIQDNTGAIVYNLAQQDMVALRVVARFAFQVANTINHDQTVEADRYPFAALLTP